MGPAWGCCWRSWRVQWLQNKISDNLCYPAPFSLHLCGVEWSGVSLHAVTPAPSCELQQKHSCVLQHFLCPQQQHLAHMEEKLRLLAQARDEAQGVCTQQKQMVADSQARASQLHLQVEGQQRRLEELQQVAAL